MASREVDDKNSWTRAWASSRKQWSGFWQVSLQSFAQFKLFELCVDCVAAAAVDGMVCPTAAAEVGCSCLVSGSNSGFKTPSKTATAGPVINTEPLRSGQLISRGPPGSFTVASDSDNPSSVAATSVAQAPVPQARVGPAPRSHTRISSVC